MALPDWLPADAWQAFVDHRKAIRKPMSAKAMSLSVGELRSLAEVFVEGAVVERSRFVSYGVGWEQQKTGVGVTVRLAWSKNAAPLEALLSLGVKTRF